MFYDDPIQLSFSGNGHTLNYHQAWSLSDEWIVFDHRNNDGAIKTTRSIGIINVKNGEERTIYTAPNQTEHGLGVGAASFSTVSDRVIFIHGLRNADLNYPYNFTRRTGVAIDISAPQNPIFMDARDVENPFTPGALRGGTHAHSWSGDGTMICFTYNDAVILQLAETDLALQDLRTIGLMFAKKVAVPETNFGNNSGEMFAVLAATVTECPTSGSDEIDKAFDECWIGSDGYMKADGTKQRKAIAFQGNVRNETGQTVTEIFVADIPDNLADIDFDQVIVGTETTRPSVPKEITQRRITFTEKGISGTRHWLRSSPDDGQIFFLAEDERGLTQAFSVSPNGGAIKQVTQNSFPITSPINVSPGGAHLSYVADQSVFITEISSGISQRLTIQFIAPEHLSGAVVWSNDGAMLAFNKYVNGENGIWLQIFLLKRC